MPSTNGTPKGPGSSAALGRAEPSAAPANGRPPAAAASPAPPPSGPFADGGGGKPQAANGRPTAPGDKDGRDGATGRFTPGNSFGRGNPHARRVAQLRSALFDVVTEDRLKRIAAKLCDLAEGGDVAAAKLVLLYVLGRPAAAADPDRLDLDAWQMLDEAPSRAQVYERLLDAMPPGEALDDFAKLLAGQGFAARLDKNNSTSTARGVRVEVEARAGRKGRRG
jgi:hypothetical protein